VLQDAIIGHTRQKELLQKILYSEKMASAYLFCGPEGVGKKLLALAFLKNFFCAHRNGCGACANCKKMDQGNHPDLLQLDPDEKSIKIDAIRAIQKHLKYHPLEAPRKVCLIDDAERMTWQAQSAFLKTLEEPTAATLFILISSQPETLLPTLCSRCQMIRFGRIPREPMIRYLAQNQATGEMDARILAAVSGGSLAKAIGKDREIYRNERRQLIEEIVSLPPPQENVLPHFQLSRRLVEHKEGLKMQLELLQLFFRDLLFVLEGRDQNDLINIDLMKTIIRRASQETADSVLAKLEALREAWQALDANANHQLTTDVLLMRLSQPAG